MGRLTATPARSEEAFALESDKARLASKLGPAIDNPRPLVSRVVDGYRPPMVANFESLRHVASELGLAMEPREQAVGTSIALLSGTIAGMPVELEQWAANYLHVYTRAFFTPAGDLGLTIEPAGLGAKIGSLLGWRDVQVGNPVIDDAYVIHAREPERVAKLFTAAVTERLTLWKGADFVVTDECVHLSLPVAPLWVTGPLTTRDIHAPEDLANNLRATLDLARTFETALRALPPSTLLAPWADTFRAYADTHRLTFSASPLSVSGELGCGQLTLHPRVTRDSVVMSVGVRLSLPAALRLRPKRLTDVFARLRPSGGPSPTGDQEVDELFTVTVAQESPAIAWLTEPVRRGLVTLQREVGDVELDGRGLTLTTRALPAPDAFPALLDRVGEIAAGLRDAA